MTKSNTLKLINKIGENRVQVLDGEETRIMALSDFNQISQHNPDSTSANSPQTTVKSSLQSRTLANEKPILEEIGSSYVFTWIQSGIIIEVSQIKESRDRVTCQINVKVIREDSPVHLLQTSLSLTSSRARTELAKELAQRHEGKCFNWVSALEEVCVVSLDKHKSVEPAIEISGGLTEKEIPKPEYLLEPILYKDKPTVFFGEGKVGKSYLALAFAILVQLPYDDNSLGLKPQKSSALILDYETDKEDAEYRLDMLTKGFSLPSVSILYRRCTLPFVEDIDNILEIVKENDIGFIIVDSVGVAASNGNLNDSQTATQFYQALRRLKVTSLLLTHTSKDNLSGNSKTAFGSVYFTNIARNIFEVKKSQGVDEDSIDVVLINRNNNIGKLLKPISYRLTFTDGKVVISQQNISNIPDFHKEVPLKYRVQEVLKHGALSVKEIAEQLDANEDSVRHALQRDENKKFVKINNTWGLLGEEQ